MPKLYNPSRGPFPLTLSPTESLSLPPKQWIPVTEQQAQATSVVDALRKGFILRREDAPVPAAPAPDAGEVPPAPTTEQRAQHAALVGKTTEVPRPKLQLPRRGRSEGSVATPSNDAAPAEGPSAPSGDPVAPLLPGGDGHHE